jgi:hypothetical protein
MTAFAHWTAMHAWWCARRTERDAIGRAWPPKKIVSGVATSVSVSGEAAAPPPTRTRGTVRKAKSDEGGQVLDSTVALQHQQYQRLTPQAKTWCVGLVEQGDTSFPWRIKNHHTVRRHKLYEGALALAEWGDGAPLLNEIVLAMTGKQNMPPGAALGHLDAEQAATFAAKAELYRQDLASPYEADGTLKTA